jgi:hypothetical protein
MPINGNGTGTPLINVTGKIKMEGRKIKYAPFRNNAVYHTAKIYDLYNLANKYIRYVLWKPSSAQAGTDIK